jgi:diguanylate cyclase (GGDEF)-like protein
MVMNQTEKPPEAAPLAPRAAIDESLVTERAVAAVRCIVLLTVFVGAVSRTGLPPSLALRPLDWLALLGGVYIILSTYPSWAGQERRQQLLVFTSLDLILVTLLVLHTGGTQSPYFILYYLPVIRAAVSLGRREAIASAVLSVACYILVGAAEGSETGSYVGSLTQAVVFSISVVLLALALNLKRDRRTRSDPQPDAQESIARIAGIYEVARALGATLDMRKMCQGVARAVTDHLDASAARVMVLAPEEGTLVLQAAKGTGPAWFEQQSAVVGEGVAGLAAARRESLLLGDPAYPPPAWVETASEPARSRLIVPMIAERRLVGVIDVIDPVDGSHFTFADREFLSAIAAQTAVAIDKVHLYEGAQMQAVTDALTHLFNHGEFDRRLADEIARGARYGRSVALCFVDLDGFKACNDIYGHRRGDSLLEQVAAVLRHSIRAADIAARYGGDEFAVILPETEIEGARSTAEKIRHAVAEYDFVLDQSLDLDPGRLTVSIGVSAFPTHAQSPEGLIDAADEALAAAKKAGRNRIQVFGDPEADPAAPEAR